LIKTIYAVGLVKIASTAGKYNNTSRAH